MGPLIYFSVPIQSSPFVIKKSRTKSISHKPLPAYVFYTLLQLVFDSIMLRCASRPFSSLHDIKSARIKSSRVARYFHRVTTDFITSDASGNLATTKVPVFIGNPGETYVLIGTGVGTALCAASPFTSTSAASAEDRCKLTFFHDSQHFGFESPSYPRLYVPSQMPRQTELNTSPATLFLGGKMHQIALDGTPDATFAEHTSATGRTLETVLRQLKDM